MSVKSLSVKKAAVIVVMLMAAVAVTVLNIRTFGPQGRQGGIHAARAQAYPVLPTDLDELVRLAGRDLRGVTPVASSNISAPVNPSRDPFLEVKPQVGKRHAKSRVKKRVSRHVKSALPVCAAVLLGGRQPLALIGGKTYGTGDHVSGYRIIGINRRGVVLVNRDGKSRTLTIGGGDTASFSVSVGSEDLAARINIERKEP